VDQVFDNGLVLSYGRHHQRRMPFPRCLVDVGIERFQKAHYVEMAVPSCAAQGCCAIISGLIDIDAEQATQKVHYL
jgi:hypothetical protein